MFNIRAALTYVFLNCRWMNKRSPTQSDLDSDSSVNMSVYREILLFELDNFLRVLPTLGTLMGNR